LREESPAARDKPWHEAGRRAVAIASYNLAKPALDRCDSRREAGSYFSSANRAGFSADQKKENRVAAPPLPDARNDPKNPHTLGTTTRNQAAGSLRKRVDVVVWPGSARYGAAEARRHE